MVQTVCNRAMTAAVVEPLGLKANWSSKLSPGGGCRSAGYIIRSYYVPLQRTWKNRS